MGYIAREQYDRASSEGETLISYLGMGGLLLVDKNEIPLELQNQDVLMICSDGLYQSVSDDELKTVMKDCANSAQMTTELRDLIKRRDYPYQDNVSFAIIKICE